jgi:hypothetical protein
VARLCSSCQMTRRSQIAGTPSEVKRADKRRTRPHKQSTYTHIPTLSPITAVAALQGNTDGRD